MSIDHSPRRSVRRARTGDRSGGQGTARREASGGRTLFGGEGSEGLRSGLRKPRRLLQGLLEKAEQNGGKGNEEHDTDHAGDSLTDENGADDQEAGKPHLGSDDPGINKAADNLLQGQEVDQEDPDLGRTGSNHQQGGDDAGEPSAQDRNQAEERGDQGDDFRIGDSDQQETQIADKTEDHGLEELTFHKVRKNGKADMREPGNLFIPAGNAEALQGALRIALNGFLMIEHIDGQEEAVAAVKADRVGQKWLDGKEPKRVIFVPNKIINVVI